MNAAFTESGSSTKCAPSKEDGSEFAKQNENQEEHNKIWDKLDKHDTRITRLETFSKL